MSIFEKDWVWVKIDVTEEHLIKAKYYDKHPVILAIEEVIDSIYELEIAYDRLKLTYVCKRDKTRPNCSVDLPFYLMSYELKNYNVLPFKFNLKVPKRYLKCPEKHLT